MDAAKINIKEPQAMARAINFEWSLLLDEYVEQVVDAFRQRVVRYCFFIRESN